MRTPILLLAVFCPLVGVSVGQPLAKPEVPTVPPERMLYAYLAGEAQKHFDARRQEVAALKTPADVHARQARLKEKFIASLGGFPQKTPLNPQVTGTLKGDGFRVEKVIYESRPDHHVTGALYLPEGKGPFPGIILPCGHSANGKAAEAYQRASISLAKHGFVVLCYDPIGQGERSQLLNVQGKPAIAGSTSEHTMVGVGSLLVGRNTATYRIWDGIRSLDYLASRPEVDAKRLGCTGNSGGGTLTAYLMALDERIFAAAPACYITSLERLFATIGPQDAEQNITGQVAFGMEHADYVTMRAPRPTLIAIATRDYFDAQGAWTTFREAKQIYGLLGHGERVDLFEFNDTHGFSKPRREAVLRFMLRWLQGKDAAPTEPDFPVFKDEELLCTRTGQVLSDRKGQSVFDINIEYERELARKRAAWLASTPREEVLKKVKELIGWKEPAAAERAGLEARTTEPGIQTFVTLPMAPLNKAQPLRIVLANVSKPVSRADNALAADLRGLGRLAPATPAKGGLSTFGTDWKEAFLALHISRPLLGQRVYDLLSLGRLEGASHPSLIVEGRGKYGPIALHAAVLDPRISSLELRDSLASWSELVQSRTSVDQLANVVPGALHYYDLPDLVALMAPRPVTIINPVDAMGRPLSKEQIEAVYARAREAYRKAGAVDKLTFENR